MLGIGLRLPTTRARWRNTGRSLDASAIFRGATLSANAALWALPRVRTWINDPPSADRIGRYRVGGPLMPLSDVAFSAASGGPFTFSRASKAWDRNAAGVWTEHANDAIRQGWNADGTPAGWLIEGGPVVNSIRNPRGEYSGATPTFPSTTLPQNWAATANTTTEIVGRGTDSQGLPYVDLRCWNNTGASLVNGISFEPITASPSQVWAFAQTLSLVSGSVSGWVIEHNMLWRDAATAGISQTSQAVVPTATPTRLSVVGTAPASTASLLPRLRLTIPNGSDAVLRIAGLQAEQNYYSSSPAFPSPGTQATTTRQADSLVVSGSAFQQIFGTGRTVRNEALDSQAFDSANWTRGRTTVVANVASPVAPDGTATADRLIEDTTPSITHIVSGTNASAQFQAGTAYTFSVYARAETRSWIRLNIASAAFGAADRGMFDLATGAVGAVANGVSASITPVGSSWYRCAITAVATATATVSFFVAMATGNNNTTYDGDGASSVLLWGAQIEAAPAAVPVNAIVAPERLSRWTLSNATLANHSTTAPDGTMADKLQEDGTNNPHQIMSPNATHTAGTITAAVHLKAGERTQARVALRDPAISGNGFDAIINLSTGAVVSSAAFGTGTSLASVTVTALSNGWYRAVLSGATGAANTSSRMDLYPASGGTHSYQGTAGQGIFAWGAQIVSGAASALPAYQPASRLVSAYVPTAAAAVSKTGPYDGGWIIADIQVLAVSPTNTFTRALELSDGTAANAIGVTIHGGDFRVNSASANIHTTAIRAGAPAAQTYRLGLRWQPGGASMCVDGGALTTALASVPPGISRLDIGNRPDMARALNARVRRIWAGAAPPSDAVFQAACAPGADVAAIIG